MNYYRVRSWVYHFIWLAGSLGLPRWLSGKESTSNAGDEGEAGSIPGSRRCPGGGNDNLLQYSCLEHPMDGAWGPWGHGESDMTLHTTQQGALRLGMKADALCNCSLEGDLASLSPGRKHGPHCKDRVSDNKQ